MDNKYPPQQAPPPGFVQPPPPYNPHQQAMDSFGPPQPANVVVMAPTVLGPESQRLVCPHCQASISTRVEPESNSKTHLFALLLCIVGLWCCAPCPYCMDTCLVKKHYCPNCGTYIGQHDN